MHRNLSSEDFVGVMRRARHELRHPLASNSGPRLQSTGSIHKPCVTSAMKRAAASLHLSLQLLFAQVDERNWWIGNLHALIAMAHQKETT